MIFSSENNNLLLSYKGPFCIDILSNLGTYIKHTFGYQSQTGNRLYKIFFELTQNVAKYSVEVIAIANCKHSGVGSFTLQENGKFLLLTTSNLINNKDGPVLNNYCSDINAMSLDNLRKFRAITRKKSLGEKDIGAHIGIIQIGLLSLNKLEFEIKNISDAHSMFSICASITK
jgi:hypothetical protein